MSPTSKSLVAFEASPSAPSASSIPELACETSTVAAYVALSAPGVGIYTTTKGGGYVAESGTSFASPVAAGVAAAATVAAAGVAVGAGSCWLPRHPNKKIPRRIAIPIQISFIHKHPGIPYPKPE